MSQSVFITSPFRSLIDERKNLAKTLNDEGYVVWLAEGEEDTQIAPLIGKHQIPIADGLDISDRCLLKLSKSDCVVAIAGNGLGSRISNRGELLQARHFELELFSALTQKKQVYTLMIDKSADRGETHEFIKSISRSNVKFIPCKSLNHGIKTLLRQLKSKPNSSNIHWNAWSTERLREFRAPVIGSFSKTRPQFSNVSDINLSVLRQLIVDIKSTDSAHLKFGRVWSAVREIEGIPVEELAHANYFEIIRDLLTEWISVAAYYGVHAHIHTGELAACRILMQISTAARQPVREDSDISALYNIGKRLPLSRRAQYMRQLQKVIYSHIDNLGERHGHHLMLGSISMRILSPYKAAEHYRKALTVMDRESDSPDIARVMLRLQLGEALVFQQNNPLVRKEISEILSQDVYYAAKHGHIGERKRAIIKGRRIAKLTGKFSIVSELSDLLQNLPDAETYLDQN